MTSISLRYFLFVLFNLFMCSCFSDNKQETQNYRFYDFYFSIKMYENPQGLIKEIIFDGIKSKDSIYFLCYSEGNEQKANCIDSVFAVTDKDLDYLYSEHLISIFLPVCISNITKNIIPPIPTSSNEWGYTIIELDLRERGNKYVVTKSYDEHLFNNVLWVCMYGIDNFTYLNN